MQIVSAWASFPLSLPLPSSSSSARPMVALLSTSACSTIRFTTSNASFVLAGSAQSGNRPSASWSLLEAVDDLVVHVDEVSLNVRRRAERPRKEERCSETRVASVVVAVSLMSRRRCPTPISSASSVSMADGAYRNVLRVSVPSCRGRSSFSLKMDTILSCSVAVANPPCGGIA
jgi:hypothetical protein